MHELRVSEDIGLRAASLNWKYILDRDNLARIDLNNKNRKGTGDINLVHKLYNDIDHELQSPTNDKQFILNGLIKEIYKQALKLPNESHKSSPIGDYDQCKSVFESGAKIVEKMPTVDRIADLFGWLKEDQISLYSTQRAYILKKELADLEHALVRYTLSNLRKKGFLLVSVPDILHHSIIESCGFATKGERNQVFKLDYSNEYGKYCMSGTSEMSLAGLLKNNIINESQLPLKLCAVSRCFRAEVSGSEREGKLYRLHEFTKVEMFVLTIGDHEISDQTLEEIKSIQTELFSDLGLHFRVLDMSTQELGAPAYKKYDIEAWMPGTQFYGEISSTSNCTDYQARRLNIRTTCDKDEHFVHTLNGTACAIPRMLTCIVESNWDMDNKCLRIPKKLQPYMMNNKDTIKAPKDFRKTQTLRQLK